ncbi:hypothetical protein, partial [Enterococcus raffinosus]|uniref:hypothetical protein n=1 Tax=Enterococcus raffinosus TaxID=71452 RepID=UPI0005595E7C
TVSKKNPFTEFKKLFWDVFLRQKSFFNNEKKKKETNKTEIVKQIAQKIEKFFDHLLTLP